MIEKNWNNKLPRKRIQEQWKDTEVLPEEDTKRIGEFHHHIEQAKKDQRHEDAKRLETQLKEFLETLQKRKTA